MKRFTYRPRLLVALSVATLLLPACSHRSGNLKVASLDRSLKVWGAEENRQQRLRLSNPGLGSSSKRGKDSPGSRYDTLWERLFALYALPKVEHRAIDREVAWFVNHPDYLERAQKRAEPFLYTIVRQLEKQHLPGELALLPVVESAFQPHAVSPANAAGIWQFIPETGRRYGLKRSRSYDGRRDVYASTRAAIKYLKKLHNDFHGDWLLAIAAYNCGEGAVAKAIQRNEARNLPTDFWSLDLPEETKAYVPRLLAVSRVFEDAEKYAINLHPIPNKAIFKPVKVDSQLDLALAADAADISLDRLFELNPGFKHQFTDVEGSYRLFVPAEKSRSFKKELSRLAMERQFDSRGSYEAETATSDRSPRTVAYRWDDSLAAEKPMETWETAMATTGADAGRIVVHIRKTSDAPRILKSEHRKESPSGALGRGVENHVPAKKGEPTKERPDKTSFRTKLALLSSGSLVDSRSTLKSGSSGAKSAPSGSSAGIKASQSIRYTVKQGETLFRISQRFGVSVADLRKWNGIKEDKIEAGRNIQVSSGKD